MSKMRGTRITREQALEGLGNPATWPKELAEFRDKYKLGPPNIKDNTVVEQLIKRTIFVAECPCQPEEPFRDVRTDTAPKEILCPHCKTWLPFNEQSYTGPPTIGKA